MNTAPFSKGNFGFNASNKTNGDVLELSILDPTKVTRTALQNAESVAGLLLTTKAPKDEAPGGGMGM